MEIALQQDSASTMLTELDPHTLTRMRGRVERIQVCSYDPF